MPLFDPVQRFEEIESRHLVVGQHQVPVVGFERGGQFRRTLHPMQVGGKAAVADMAGEEEVIGFGVLDQQDVERFHKVIFLLRFAFFRTEGGFRRSCPGPCGSERGSRRRDP